MQAALYKTDGDIIQLTPINDTDFSLEELQALVGGYITIVPAIQPELIIVCDEDGIPKGLTENPLVSLYSNHKIFGDAILCNRDMVK